MLVDGRTERQAAARNITGRKLKMSVSVVRRKEAKFGFLGYTGRPSRRIYDVLRDGVKVGHLEPHYDARENDRIVGYRVYVALDDAELDGDEFKLLADAKACAVAFVEAHWS